MHPFINFFNITIPSYGLLMVVGLMTGMLIFYLCARSKGIDGLDSFILASYSLIAGLAGAKLLSILTSLGQLLSLWQAGYKEAFWYFLINGGMVFYGGVITGFVTFVLVAKHHHINLLTAMDSAAPALAFGHFFGRLGCFSVGCCYGIPHDHLGISFEHSPIAPNDIPLLPVQLYEAGFNLFLSLVLLLVFIKGRRGLSSAVYLLAYGVWRFVIEFWRGDSYRGFLLGLSTSQWISIGMIIIGLVILFKSKKPGTSLARTK